MVSNMPRFDDNQQTTTMTTSLALTSNLVIKAIVELVQAIVGILVCLATIEVHLSLALVASTPPVFLMAYRGTRHGGAILAGRHLHHNFHSHPLDTIPLLTITDFLHRPSLDGGFYGCWHDSCHVGIPRHDICTNNTSGTSLFNGASMPLMHGASMFQALFSAIVSTFPFVEAPITLAHDTRPTMAPLHFYKLDFSTDDGSEDSLN
ncbi:hypothetical protein GUJ93_ZPchr0004g39313 [Zizania palustris]|uniref:Uncharacterized protein n=1 Tax=Zizania palustris TaxID=103762 RepID=A0A8J5SCS2_ZIZPA|nr:hypothetical protein GUJ93_ZPchr0004g39313 [Zizania palustris]